MLGTFQGGTSLLHGDYAEFDSLAQYQLEYKTQEVGLEAATSFALANLSNREIGGELVF